MAEFTREQLIACAETALSDARTAVNFHDSKPYHQMRVHLAEIALAALTEQPVGFYRASRHGDGYYLANNMEQTPGTIPLYRLPLLEGLK